MRSDPKNRRAIAAIPAEAWVAIRYPNAVYDDQLQMWYSDAEVAEVPYTAFTSKKAHTTAGRMIVRRVRRLNPRAAEGQHVLPGMPDEVTYRYHAVFTSNPHPMLEAEAEHRDHAVFEQIFADSIDGPLAHLPSGDFSANAAWVTLAAITQNILRAVGALASLFHARARCATLRRDLINVPAKHPTPGGTPSPCAASTAGTPRRRALPCTPRPGPGRAAPPPSRPDPPGTGHRTRERPAAATPSPVPHPERSPQSQRRGGRRDPHARDHLEELLVQRSGRKRSTEIRRWIQAQGGKAPFPGAVGPAVC